MTKPTEKSYDEYPYPGGSFWFTHPDHMAIVAEVHGMAPADPRTCRVLELGCGDGTNILNIAASLPGATCVGVDLSESQIRLATSVAERAGITNARLLQADVCDIDESFGTFDFVVSHGVYSWIPAFARDGLLRAIGKTLAPHGVAMVSYNAFPGWHDLAPIRRLLKFHTDPVAAPDAKVRLARMMAEVYCRELAELDRDGRSKLAEKLQKNVAAMTDHLMRHDWLAEHHHPVYFSDFIDHARRYGLDYLDNACPAAHDPDALDPNGHTLVTAVADRVRRQQYTDFLMHPRFRTTLLKRTETAITDELQHAHFVNYRIESRLDADELATPVPEAADFGIADEQAARLEKDHKKYKAVLRAVARDAPRPIAVREAFDLVVAEVVAEGLDEGLGATEAGRAELHAAFIREIAWLFRRELIHCWKFPPNLARKVPERPQTGILQRILAQRRLAVTSLAHREIPLTAIEGKILVDLDGTHTVEELETKFGAETKSALESLLLKGFLSGPADG